MQRLIRQLAVAADRAEQRALRLSRQAGSFYIGVEIGFSVVIAWHLVVLFTFFVQPHPEATVLPKYVFHPHRDNGTDAREAVEHEADQRLVA